MINRIKNMKDARTVGTLRVLLALLATISTLNAAPIARPAFETETWAKGRTLTWSKPGISGEIGDASGCIESD